MVTKRIVLEFEFEEAEEDDYTELSLAKITRQYRSPLTDGELSGLGDQIWQSDFWQVYVVQDMLNLLITNQLKSLSY